MNRFIITFLIISLGLPVFAEPLDANYKQLENIQQNFFESATVPLPEVKVEREGNSEYSDSSDKFKNNKPYFMQMRLKLMYKLRQRQKAADEKFLEKQKLRQEKQAQKQNSRFENYLKDIKYVEYDEENTKETEAKQSKDTEQTALTGEIKEQAVGKEMMLDCDELSVVDETGEIQALGNPILILPAQNIKLTADKMYYNNDANILKAVGNVVLTKNGVPVYGDYMQVNMNEENVFMDNTTTTLPTLKLHARNTVSEQDKLILTKGSLYSEQSNTFKFVSRMIGPDFTSMIIDEKDQFKLMGNENSKFKISASRILVDAKKYTDTVTVKDAEVYHNDRYWFTLPSFTAHTDKDHQYVEANYPEFGSMSKMGMFFGPGFVFDTPLGSSIKLMPLLNYKSKFGFGGAVKYHSAFNSTNFMYGSANDTFVLNGKQILDEHLFLQYGSNAYMDDWFLGRRMPKYMAELVYRKGTTINDFLAEGRDLNFMHSASAGYMQDGDWNLHTEHLSSSGIGTMRFRYMAQIDQSLFKYKDEKNRKYVDFGIIMQGSAALYGTGDTQFIGRIGPRLHTQYKYWMQDIGYYQGAYSDHTPLPVYDTYRYGHSSVYIREALRLNKLISVGWSGTVTLSGDSPNGEPFQENAFYVSLGPDDLKINLGYDIMRRMTYFTVALLLDTKDTVVNFDKMEIKNPERLGQSDKKNDDVAFKQPETQNSTSKSPKKLEYAQVIDIEDPDKESI